MKTKGDSNLLLLEIFIFTFECVLIDRTAWSSFSSSAFCDQQCLCIKSEQKLNDAAL